MSRRKKCFEEAFSIVKQIPTYTDRVERYRYIAELSADVSTDLCRQSFEAAMQHATEGSQSQLRSLRREILDAAYRIDPEIATSLASLVDDDPARVAVRKNLHTDIERIQSRKRLIGRLFGNRAESNEDTVPPVREHDYPALAWDLLAELNSDRIVTVEMIYTRDFVTLAAEMPLPEAYPILSWVIENTTRRYKNTRQARTYIRPLFEATLTGAQLCTWMANRSGELLKQVKGYSAPDNTTQTAEFKSGDHDSATAYLAEWIGSEVGEYLKIVDPVFSLEDLQLLRLIQSIKPDCRIEILTGKSHLSDLSPNWEQAYSRHWRQHIAEHDPPDTYISVISVESTGHSPMADLLWLSDGCGLRMSHSFSDFGYMEDSAITHLSEKEARTYEQEFDEYVLRRKRQYNGEKVQLSAFTLDG